VDLRVLWRRGRSGALNTSGEIAESDLVSSSKGHQQSEATLKHVVMFSGGIGSWAAAKRVAAQFGQTDLMSLFADTLIEKRRASGQPSESPVSAAGYIYTPGSYFGRHRPRVFLSELHGASQSRACSGTPTVPGVVGTTQRCLRRTDVWGRCRSPHRQSVAIGTLEDFRQAPASPHVPKRAPP
jgi:hypothetical protein